METNQERLKKGIMAETMSNMKIYPEFEILEADSPYYDAKKHVLITTNVRIKSGRSWYFVKVRQDLIMDKSQCSQVILPDFMNLCYSVIIHGNKHLKSEDKDKSQISEKERLLKMYEQH